MKILNTIKTVMTVGNGLNNANSNLLDEHNPKVKGVIDIFNKIFIKGWACEINQHTPVELEIRYDDIVIDTVVADKYRKDLEKNNIGNGYHSFEYLFKKDYDLSRVSINDKKFQKRLTIRPNIVPSATPTQPFNRFSTMNVFLIYGQPNQGKTSLSTAIEKYSGRFCSVIHTDRLFMNESVRSIIPDKFMVHREGRIQPNIHGYITSDVFDEGLILQGFDDYFRGNIASNSDFQLFDLVIEGFLLNVLKDEVKNILMKYGVKQFFEIEMDNFSAAFDGQTLSSESMEKKESSSGRVPCPQLYDGIVKSIFADIKKMNTLSLTKASTYQQFDMLNDTNGASQTLKKYQSLVLPELKDKTVLDIGCNAGYFCFKFSEFTASRVVGIDCSPKFIEIADKFNKTVFRRGQVEFLNIDVFDYHGIFDLIYCSSVFHYFRERQIEFLNKCYSMLNKNGILILEVELSTKENDIPFIEKYARGVDATPCYFPNEIIFTEWINKLFTIENKSKSVFQEGSRYNRYFFNLRKINSVQDETE